MYNILISRSPRYIVSTVHLKTIFGFSTLGSKGETDQLGLVRWGRELVGLGISKRGGLGGKGGDKQSKGGTEGFGGVCRANK